MSRPRVLTSDQRKRNARKLRRKWIENNKEKWAAYSAEYRKLNRDRINQRKRESYNLGNRKKAYSIERAIRKVRRMMVSRAVKMQRRLRWVIFKDENQDLINRYKMRVAA